MVSSAFTTRHANAKRKSPQSACASEALHQHYYAGESRVYSYTPIISRVSSIVKARYIVSRAARHGAAARRRHRRRGGSASTPSAASRREAFTRSSAGGSLDAGSAGGAAFYACGYRNRSRDKRHLIMNVIYISSLTLNFAWIALARSSISEASSLSDPAIVVFDGKELVVQLSVVELRSEPEKVFSYFFAFGLVCNRAIIDFHAIPSVGFRFGLHRIGYSACMLQFCGYFVSAG